MKVAAIFCVLILCSNVVLSSEDGYDQKVYELGLLLKGAEDIGAKSCKGAGSEMPASLSNWWSAIKTYSAGEVARDKLLNERVAALENKLQELTTTEASAVQVASLELQIGNLSASIESVNGEVGRIPLREKLLLAILKSLEENAKEHAKTMEAYFNLRDTALKTSFDVATAACARKKKVQNEVEEKDPVPGCEEVLAKIPSLKSGLLNEYGETYFKVMASIGLNDKMQEIALEIKNIMASLPRSNDTRYDWSTPMETALAALEEARQKSGAKCPESDDENWKVANTVIGQAGNRPEYFDYIALKVNEILVLDRIKLENLLLAKEKMQKMLDALKGVATTVEGVASSAETSSTSSTSNSASVSSGQTSSGSNSSASTQGQESSAVVSNQLALASSGTSSAILGSSASASSSGKLSVLSNGVALNSLSLSGASLAIAKKSQSAIAQIEKKNSSIKGAESALKKAAESSSSAKSKASTVEKTSFIEKMKKSLAKTQSEKVSKDVSSAVTATSLGVTSGTSAISSGSLSLGTNSVAQTNLSTTEAMLNAQILSQSIVAKKYKNKTEYEATEEDSLFERVTKAYIRNYEKVEERNP